MIAKQLGYIYCVNKLWLCQAKSTITYIGIHHITFVPIDFFNCFRFIVGQAEHGNMVQINTEHSQTETLSDTSKYSHPYIRNHAINKPAKHGAILV